eukprot:scaffold752_cov322-Pavlova_lutheri.AAC.12
MGWDGMGEGPYRSPSRSYPLLVSVCVFVWPGELTGPKGRRSRPTSAPGRASMSPPTSGPALPVHKTLLASAVATCTAEALTLPIDTAKVRLQLQKVKPGEAPMYSGMVGTIKTVAKEEGVAALWKGIVPGLHRQCVYGGLRIGLYDPVKQSIVGKDHVGEVPLLKKIAAALTTGAVGIAIASPTDLVKVRMQAEGKLPEGTPKRYPTTLGAYRTIAKEEGVASLWRGVGPNMTRNAVINAAELATYDQIKEALLRSGAFTDNVVTHLISGLGAGFIAVCVGSPVDVVKSRLMGSKGEFTGTIDCFVKTMTREGPTAFYKGFVPNFGRLGSWNVAMFMVLEQTRKALQ